MELWIRNQSGKLLIKCNNVIIEEYSNGDVDIRQYDSEHGSFKLGTYESVERAIEVLDEIENILKHNLIINCNQRFEYGTDGMPYSIKTIGTNGDNIQELSTCVYEMPEK